MTRAEHFALARRAGIAALVFMLLLAAAAVASLLSKSSIPLVLGPLAFLGTGFFAVVAVYRLLMGFSRAADWQPPAGEPLESFEPSEEEQSLRRRIQKELGVRVTGPVIVEHENLLLPGSVNPRTRWRQFWESTEVMIPRHRLTLSIPTEDRRLLLSVWIGRTPRDPAFARIRVVIETVCRVSIHEPLLWRRQFTGDSKATRSLADDKDLAHLLRGLVRRRILSRGTWIFHPDPSFALEPLAEPGQARVILDTLEQDWKGGFVVKLGLEGLLAAAERIEFLRADSTPSAPSPRRAAGEPTVPEPTMSSTN